MPHELQGGGNELFLAFFEPWWWCLWSFRAFSLHTALFQVVTPKATGLSWRFHREIFTALFLSLSLCFSLLSVSPFVYIELSPFWYPVLQTLVHLAFPDSQIHQMNSEILPGFSYLSPFCCVAWKRSPKGIYFPFLTEYCSVLLDVQEHCYFTCVISLF